ncbi:MAG: hypothetical protein ACF8Q5_02185 [Phycisphaerales bacterium JB040]
MNTRRRFVLAVLLSISASFFIPVLIAVLAAIRSEPVGQYYLLQSDDRERFVAANRLALVRGINKPGGSSFTHWLPGVPFFVQIPGEQPPRSLRHITESFGSLGSSSDVFSNKTAMELFYRDTSVDGLQYYEEIAYGWPFLTLYSASQLVDDKLVTHNGIETSWSALGSQSQDELITLPTGVIWRGLILNALIYASVLLAIPLGLSILFRHQRYLLGHCPKCRYDLQHDFSHGCPECGWRKDRDSKKLKLAPSKGTA